MIKRGLTLVAAMHITASVFINDDESGLHHDYEVWLEKLAPHAPIDQYWHNQTWRGRQSERSDRKADSHLKRQIMGREVVVAVTKGGSTGAPGSGSSKARREGWPLSLDGRRRKRVLVNVIGQWERGLPNSRRRDGTCSSKWNGRVTV
jgi:hypothetical protein